MKIDDPILSINPYPKETAMRAGQKVIVKLLKSESSPSERLRAGFPVDETYEGVLLCDVKAGQRLYVGDLLITSVIRAIDPVGPETFQIKTLYSLYELKLA